MAGDATAGLSPAWIDLKEERVVVGDRPLLLVRPGSSEALIDEERFARDEFLPYWAELWPSALALAAAVDAVLPAVMPTRPRPGPLRVVELGCGLGLPSLAAALHGADVVATDWAGDALAFVAENARRNELAVDVLECAWTEPEPLLARGPFDVVLASDVLYERGNVAPLAELAPLLVAPGGTVLVADPGRPALPEFLEAVQERGWRVEDATPAAIPVAVPAAAAAAAAASRAGSVAGAPGRVRVHRLVPA